MRSQNYTYIKTVPQALKIALIALVIYVGKNIDS
jgi:hypothetical protein